MLSTRDRKNVKQPTFSHCCSSEDILTSFNGLLYEKVGSRQLFACFSVPVRDNDYVAKSYL